MTGLTLIELMIAMTLGLIIVGAVGWVYVNTARTYRLQDGAARLQEGARFAFETMSNDLRMAGTTGCGFNTKINVINSTAWFNKLFEQPLAGAEKDGIVGSVTEFSDALRVVRADVSREYAIATHDLATSTFTLTAAHNLSGGELLVATDCQHAAVFQASAASGSTVNHLTSGTPGNLNANLGMPLGTPYTYSAANGSRIYVVRATTYYVATNPAGVPALYRLRLGGTEELVEGVDNLQITFGVDNTTAEDGVVDLVNGIAYLTAAQIESAAAGVKGASADERWKRVKSVKVSLVMRTIEDNVSQEYQHYDYNGATVTATDHRLRKVFTHVIDLRNWQS